VSMHLEKPWINTNGRSKNRRKPNALQLRAKQEHEDWLRKRGLHATQIADKRSGGRKTAKVSGKVPDIATPGYVYESRRPQTSDQVGNGFRTGIMDKLHLEPPRVREEILKKAQRVESLYSKGPTQYVTDGTDTTMLGSRSRRG
jgi:hypothetical protein